MNRNPRPISISLSEKADAEDSATEVLEFDPADIKSDKITAMQEKIEKLRASLKETRGRIQEGEAELKELDAEYGSEIARVKKEFARIKERAYEESADLANKAKVDALKEVLPITDNYFRAKSVFEPAQTDGEKAILATYDAIFESFSDVIADFGVTRVQSLGQPFDFNFMEAVMTMDSTEYAKDLVCTEYQVGYKMGEKCIRPAMVVVSTGPGPL